MTDHQQFTLDGSAVPYSEAAHTPTRRSRPLTVAQQRIMRVVHTRGSIRAYEAGMIVHAQPGRSCGFGAKSGGETRGCCAYASTDGSAALNRLMARGLVVRGARGDWTAP